MKHIVVFSHGFGTKKDSRGLFIEISNSLLPYNIESITFDYDEINGKEHTTKPFSQQTKIFQAVLDETIKNNPGAIIDIISQSQGLVMVALAKIKGVRKIIGMSPFFHTDIHKVLERYKKFPQSEINLNGVSKRYRTDGSITVIPKEYWLERFATNVYEIYNKLALDHDLTIINAAEDQIIDSVNLLKIFNAKIINIHGDHDFSGKYRPDLINILKKIII